MSFILYRAFSIGAAVVAARVSFSIFSFEEV
jgi:hypothetical protein